MDVIKNKSDGLVRFQAIGFAPLDFEALKKDSKFKMLLKQTEIFKNYKLNWFSEAKKRMDKSFTLIEKELAND